MTVETSPTAKSETKSPDFPIGEASPVTFDIEPSEGGKVLYQKVAAPKQGGATRGMAYFLLSARNHTDKTLVARKLVVSFPGSSLPDIEFASRDVSIAAGASAEVGLGKSEQLVLPSNPPSTIAITLVFDGLADPVKQSWPLVPHAKSYAFFAKPESSTKHGEFVLMPGVHVKFGGGSQHFGYDVKSLGINKLNGQYSTYKTDGLTNADLYAWERPIYAVADGIVVTAIRDNVDNDSPVLRNFVRKGDYQGTRAINAVSVVDLDASRMLAATISDAGVAWLTVLEQSPDGKQVIRLCEASGATADSVVVAGLGKSRAVSATVTGGNAQVSLWKLSADGKSLDKLGERRMPGISQIRLARLSDSRIAVIGRATSGNLTLSIHDCPKAGNTISEAVASASGGTIETVEMIALSSTRVVAAVKGDGALLKLIVWDLVSSEPSAKPVLVRVGEAGGTGTISELALAASEVAGRIGTAVRTQAGLVKLIIWDVLDSGDVVRRGDVETEAGSHVKLAFFKTKSFALGYRLPNGKLRVAAWEANDDAKTNTVKLEKLYQSQTAGTTDRLAMSKVQSEQRTVLTALRTEDGVLKVILWQFTDSNLIRVLHGNEMLSFVHLREGSIPDALMVPGAVVKQGQMIGRMGHSGKSDGPHCHIHAVRIPDAYVTNVPKLIADVAAGNSIGALRPMHWRGVRAMRQQNLVPGWKNNPMTELKGEGTYFENYVVWPAIGDP